MANPNPILPPIAGRWKPGQSGNPSGRPKKKPLTEALQRVLAKLSDDERDVLCQELITKVATGDVAAFKEVADRVEGKVPQGIGQAEELGALQISWKQPISSSITNPDDNSFLSTIEESASLVSSPTDEPEKQ
mgnify:CR=1 FL=1